MLLPDPAGRYQSERVEVKDPSLGEDVFSPPHTAVLFLADLN